MSELRPEVYRFLDYREYLKRFTDFLKSEGRFSARTFARKAGFSSPSFYKMVLDGKRNLSSKSLAKITSALELQRREADFFETLVQFNQAVEIASRDQFYQRLLKFKQFLTITRTAAAQYEYFSNWKVVAAFEALGTAWSRQSISKQAESLDCSTEELKNIFKTLEALGLAERADDGWQKKADSFTTPPEMASLNVRNHHRQMIQKSLEAVDHVDQESRQLGSLTIALSEREMKDFKKQLFEFLHEMNARYSRPGEKDRVCQLNVQLFNLLRV